MCVGDYCGSIGKSDEPDSVVVVKMMMVVIMISGHVYIVILCTVIFT